MRVHVRRGSDRIVGATIVAARAGDLIGELVLAMRSGTGLRSLGAVIHPCPTQAEALRWFGDAYNRSHLTPRLRQVLGQWFSLRR